MFRSKLAFLLLIQYWGKICIPFSKANAKKRHAFFQIAPIDVSRERADYFITGFIYKTPGDNFFFNQLFKKVPFPLLTYAYYVEFFSNHGAQSILNRGRAISAKHQYQIFLLLTTIAWSLLDLNFGTTRNHFFERLSLYVKVKKKIEI